MSVQTYTANPGWMDRDEPMPGLQTCENGHKFALPAVVGRFTPIVCNACLAGVPPVKLEVLA